MSQTWAQIRKNYLQGTGDAHAAASEAYGHISAAHRRVASDPRIDVPELAAIDDSVIILAGSDYTEVSSIDPDLYAVLTVVNKTDGRLIYPEPGGMTGRSRYFEAGTGKPPTGSITHYQRDGSRLWVRNTPSADTVLTVRLRRQVPDITEADLNSSPLTPAQYDWAIIWYAVGNYLSVHPQPNEHGEPGNADQRYFAMAEAEIGRQVNPRKDEDRPRLEPLRLRGYSLRPRSRWG
jgi:hypothetical protein